MCVPSKTLCPFSNGCKLAYLVFHRKRLEPKMLPWQQHRRCLSVSFVMHIFGAKFEEHCSNISRDILYSVFYCSNGTTYDIITFLVCIIQKRNFSRTKKDIPRRETPFFFTLKSLSNKQQLFFYFIGTLIRKLINNKRFKLLTASSSIHFSSEGDQSNLLSSRIPRTHPFSRDYKAVPCSHTFPMLIRFWFAV